MAKPKTPSPEEIRRNEQRAQLEVVIKTLEEEVAGLGPQQSKLHLLQSVSDGLYDEVDKLTKKSPADTATDLLLEQANEFIADSKVLAKEDPYVQRMKQFVPAGDNPEHRDVLIVLRQLRQGLERFSASLDSNQERYQELLDDANGLKTVLRLYFDGHDTISVENLGHYGVDLTSRWIEGADFNKSFSFDVLDQTDIPKYFATPL